VVASFTPHLIPMNRGILATIYVKTLGGRSAENLHGILQQRFGGEAFVRILPFGTTPHTRFVRGTNFVHIGVAKDRREDRAIVVAALDNLVKGASGQAVQNMNLMLGLPETAGLDAPALYP
jgi:N-acetyl-gamma-glutamyl-phosphate reductase